MKNFSVHYIHRSVAEYLDDIDIQSRVAETSGPKLDVNVAILNTLAITWRYGVYLRFLEIFSRFNRQAEQSTKKAQSMAVNELDFHMSDPRYNLVGNDMANPPSRIDRGAPLEGEHWGNHVIEKHTRRCLWHDTILAVAIRYDWELYVVEKLNERGSGLPAKLGRPLLDYAVRPQPPCSTDVHGMNPRIVACLLEHGADPNAEFNGYSAWSNALYYVFQIITHVVQYRVDLAMDTLQVVEAMKLLLAHGAAKRASCMAVHAKTTHARVRHTRVKRVVRSRYGALDHGYLGRQVLTRSPQWIARGTCDYRERRE
jgi:hypothetical protein